VDSREGKKAERKQRDVREKHLAPGDRYNTLSGWSHSKRQDLHPQEGSEIVLKGDKATFG